MIRGVSRGLSSRLHEHWQERREQRRPRATVCLFDVFETLLMRRVATVQDVFFRLGERLASTGQWSGSALEFATLRERAEACAQGRSRSEGQFQLSDLALGLSELGGVPLDVARGWLDQELLVEGELLEAMPGAVELVSQRRRAGCRIAYVSDMYLPSAVLSGWLVREGIALPEEPVFVSGEVGVCKGTGRLFTHALTVLGATSAEAEHFGNNRHADVEGARRVGVRPRFCEQGNLTPHEKRLADDGPGRWGSALACASRRVRLQLPQQGTADSLSLSLAEVGAPLLVSFVAHVLLDARRTGVERLAFLARDGEVLLRIAEVLAPRLGVTIPCQYLLCSRRTWGLATLLEPNERGLSWVFEPSAHLSVSSCLARAGLSCEPFGELLSQSGFPEGQRARNLSRPERERLRSLVLTDASMRSALSEKSRELRGLTLDYLRQEGLLSCGTLGLVDLGWHGTLQQCLRDLLDGMASERVALVGFYAGLNRSARLQVGPTNRAFGYVRDEYRGLGVAATGRLRQLGFILETLCSASHGSLIDYRRETDAQGSSSVVGVLDPGFDPRPSKAARAAVLETSLSIAELVDVSALLSQQEHSSRGTMAAQPVPSSPELEQTSRVAKVLIDNLQRLWQTPTRQEAQGWGRLPVDDRQGAEKRDARLAVAFPPVAPLQVLLGDSKVVCVPWFSGALAQSDPLTRLLLRGALKVRKSSRSEGPER